MERLVSDWGSLYIFFHCSVVELLYLGSQILVLWRQSPDLAECHLHCILLVKDSHEVSLNSRGRYYIHLLMGLRYVHAETEEFLEVISKHKLSLTSIILDIYRGWLTNVSCLSVIPPCDVYVTLLL